MICQILWFNFCKSVTFLFNSSWVVIVWIQLSNFETIFIILTLLYDFLLFSYEHMHDTWFWVQTLRNMNFWINHEYMNDVFMKHEWLMSDSESPKPNQDPHVSL